MVWFCLGRGGGRGEGRWRCRWRGGMVEVVKGFGKGERDE